MSPPQSSFPLPNPRDPVASEQLLLALLRGMDDLRHQLAAAAGHASPGQATPQSDPTTRPCDTPDHTGNPDIRFWYYTAR